MDRSPLSIGGARHIIFKVIQTVCEKDNKFNVCSFGKTLIKANPLGNQKAGNNTLSEFTFCLPLTCPGSWC
jgi:hypothetical protein